MKAEHKKLQEQVAANQQSSPWKRVWRLYGPHIATQPECFEIEKIEVRESATSTQEALLEIELKDIRPSWLLPCETRSGSLQIENVGNGCALIHAHPCYGVMLLDSNI